MNTVSFDVGSLDKYIKTVNSFKFLSKEEEYFLANKFKKENDLNAAQQLIYSQLKSVIYIANSYSGYNLSREDLIQEGNIGLMKAVKNYDPEHGVRLFSYAVHWVHAEIKEFIIRNWRLVKIASGSSSSSSSSSPPAPPAPPPAASADEAAAALAEAATLLVISPLSTKLPAAFASSEKVSRPSV